MRWLPIRWRLTLFYTITMLVIVVGMILAMYAVIGNEQTRRIRDRVSDCASIAAPLVSDTGTLDADRLNSSGCSGVSVAVLNRDGQVLYETGTAIGVGQTFPGDMWKKSLNTGQTTQDNSLHLSAPVAEPRYAYAIPLSDAGSPDRVVVASIPYASMGEDTVFIVTTVVAGVAILVLVVIVLASYFLVRSSFAPVTAITATARQISGSDLSRRLPVENPRDELGQLSQTINDLLARLEVAFRQREQALDDQRRFVADASHELRTPLTSILGYTRMLRQWGLDHPETAKEGIVALEQEAERMHGLVESLLRLARGEELPAMHAAGHDLRDVIADAVEASRAFGAGQQDIVADVPGEPVGAMIDPAMMLQALEVLLDNAVKYAGSAAPVEVSLRTDGANARIRVTDHGAGIAPQYLPHLFDRFYRAEESRTTRGSGLGLAIAKQIAEQHGGTISVESVVGEGTTFVIVLPLQVPSA